MERFIERHEDRINGIIAGYDRVIFRGTLRSISYVKGMEIWLSSRGVLFKEFGKYAEGISQEITRHAEEMAKQAGQKVEYLNSAKESKEEIAHEIAEERGIKEGLVCILSSVEPCHSYSVRGDRESHKLRLVWEPRKCLHFYFYYLDREFGLMHVQLQSWFPYYWSIWEAPRADPRVAIRAVSRCSSFCNLVLSGGTLSSIENARSSVSNKSARALRVGSVDRAIFAASGTSIQDGTFRRLPRGSSTVTAPATWREEVKTSSSRP
jgi:hypothetical protein